jgi:hypothetical protein
MCLSTGFTSTFSTHPIPKIAAALSLALLLFISTLILLNQETALAQVKLERASAPKAANLIIGSMVEVGDPLDRIQCLDGYTATAYAKDLAAPHGLALDLAGNLYVSEATLGRVSQVGTGGVITPLITGLADPEGVTLDNLGNLYVVEDIEDGRVVKRAANGVTTTLAAGLENPEGITWVNEGGGILYVTESTLQSSAAISSIDPNDYRTYVTTVPPAGGAATRILTRTAEVLSVSPTVNVSFWSYTGDIVKGSDGLLYFSNELSGQEISGTTTVEIIPGFPISVTYHFSSTESIFTIDPADNPATESAFADGLIAPEGLSFSANGEFPLYVTEEDIGGGVGRLSRVDAAGSETILCTGFSTLEDLVVGADGSLYVAEDINGLIIRIRNEPVSEPPPTPTSTPTSTPEPGAGTQVWLPIILH